MLDFLIAALLLSLLGGAAYYLHRTKKRSHGCIGCPCSGQCGGKCREKHK